jgi:hypothetical protein
MMRGMGVVIFLLSLFVCTYPWALALGLRYYIYIHRFSSERSQITSMKCSGYLWLSRPGVQYAGHHCPYGGV